MTGIATYGRFGALVAIDTPLHFHGLLDLHDLLLQDVAVATFAFHFGGHVLPVTEENKVGRFIDATGWNLPVGHIHVTDATLGNYRKPRQVPARRFLVAGDTLEFQRGVLLVIERSWFFGSMQRYGKEKATNESEYLSLYLFPPPAAITTYCFLFLFETKVMGVA